MSPSLLYFCFCLLANSVASVSRTTSSQSCSSEKSPNANAINKAVLVDGWGAAGGGATPDGLVAAWTACAVFNDCEAWASAINASSSDRLALPNPPPVERARKGKTLRASITQGV